MAQVNINVNSRDYKVTCDDGQEERLQQLAAYFDQHVSNIAGSLGQIGDTRLMLLGALTLTDELFEARDQLGALAHANDKLEPDTLGGAAKAIDAVTERVQELTSQLDE